MEMQEPLRNDPIGMPVRQDSRHGSPIANRQLWKNAIYTMALITYLCSFLFFGLAVADARQTGGSTATVIDLLVALYFLVQVIFLFVLSGVVERRRQSQPIDFPDRRERT